MRRILFCLFFLCATVFAETSNWDQWLQNEGYYLLSADQKQKFQALPDAQKQTYIDNLWASLDPDAVTPENEFKIEYQQRYDYAKKHYGVPSDRAKIYILLGKPNAVQTEPNSDKYYPLELWSYYSLGIRGLPSSLDLIFFKKWGAGDYKLYSPIFDGFKSLTPSGMDFENVRVQSQLKAYFDPQIVDAAQHITTGADANESEVIRATLNDPSALNRLVVQQKQRPNVETTIVYQGFNADVYAYAFPYENDIFRTSVAVAVSPKYVTLEKDEDKGVYRGRIELTGKITDEKGNEIIRINDSPAMQFSSADFEKAKGYFLSYLFDVYLLPGKYTLDCLFRDLASNAAGKLEKSFEVKTVSGDLELLPPLLAYKTIPATADQMPFGYDSQQYFPKENSAFNDGQQIVIYTALFNPKKIRLSGLWKLDISVKKDGNNVMQLNEDVPVSTTGNLDLARRVQLQNLAPGSYIVAVKLTQGERGFLAESPLKINSDAEILGRMRVTATSSSSPESYHTNVALQHLYRNELEEAAKHVRIALDFAPSSYPARSLSARIEKAKGNTAGAIAAYEKLLQQSPGDSEGFFTVGKWALEMRDWKKASDMMKKAMSAGFYTTELLNNLAFAQIQLGNKAEAIDFWEKSLALNSNQPDIQKQLSTYKR